MIRDGFAADGRLLSGGPCLVGVLNLTPDSFSDGGRFADVAAAVDCGLAMVQAGAHWIDIGGESTRPGARAVDASEEIARVVPVVLALSQALWGRALISVDTYKAATAQAALDAGANVVNDVSGGRLDPDILAVAATFDAPVVLGHMRGTPSTMMDGVPFKNVVAEVIAELQACVAAAKAAGCRHVWADPGIGFGKGLPENLALLRNLAAVRTAVAVPLMVGVSRKRFLGELTGQPVGARGYATAAALAMAVQSGVNGLRVHDIEPARDVVTIVQAVQGARLSQ